MVKTWTAIVLALALLLPAAGCARTDQGPTIEPETVREEETSWMEDGDRMENSGREEERSPELDGGGRSESPSAENPALPDFSYEEDAALYRPGDPGVNSRGFVNVDPRTVDSREAAVERAEHECTVAYDATEVWYDSDAGMWKVLFYTNGMAGGSQTVYLSSDGVTNLVVYGE